MLEKKQPNHNIPHEVYRNFFKEIDCENISIALKKVGAGQRFQAAFKNSKSYKDFIESLSQEKEKPVKPKRVFKSEIKEEDVSDIANLLRFGYSFNEIGKRYNLEHNLIRYAILKHPILSKIKRKQKGIPVLVENLNELKSLVKNGASLSELSKVFKVHTSTVSKFLKTNKIIVYLQFHTLIFLY